MDKKELKKVLETLLSESDKFSYDALPKGDYGYPSSAPPEWEIWVRRIRNAIQDSFKKESSIFALIEKGEEHAEVITGNGRNVFDEAKNNLVKSVETAIVSREFKFQVRQIIFK